MLTISSGNRRDIKSATICIFGLIIVINCATAIDYDAYRKDTLPRGTIRQSGRTSREVLERLDLRNSSIPTLQDATEHFLRYGALLRTQILDVFGKLVYDHYDDFSMSQIEALYRIHRDTLERKYNIFDIVPSILEDPDTRPTKICSHINEHVRTCLKESTNVCMSVKIHDEPHEDMHAKSALNETRRIYRLGQITRNYPNGFSLKAVLYHLRANRLHFTPSLFSGLLLNVQYDNFGDRVRTAERKLVAFLGKMSGKKIARKLRKIEITGRSVSHFLKNCLSPGEQLFSGRNTEYAAYLSQHVVREVTAVSENIELLGTVYDNSTINLKYLFELILPNDTVDHDVVDARDYLVDQIERKKLVEEYLRIEKYQQTGPDQLLLEILGQLRDIGFAEDLATSLHAHARFWHKSQMIENLNELLELFEAYENLRHVNEYKQLVAAMDRIKNNLRDSRNITIELLCTRPRDCLRMGLEIVANCTMVNDDTKRDVQLFIDRTSCGCSCLTKDSGLDDETRTTERSKDYEEVEATTEISLGDETSSGNIEIREEERKIVTNSVTKSSDESTTILPDVLSLITGQEKSEINELATSNAEVVEKSQEESCGDDCSSGKCVDCETNEKAVNCTGSDCLKNSQEGQSECEGENCSESSCEGENCSVDDESSEECEECKENSAETNSSQIATSSRAHNECQGPDCSKNEKSRGDKICEGSDCSSNKSEEDKTCEGSNCSVDSKVQSECEGSNCPISSARINKADCEGLECLSSEQGATEDCQGEDCTKAEVEKHCEGSNCSSEQTNVKEACEGPDCPREKVDKSCEGPDCPGEKDEISCEGPDCPGEKDEISCEGPDCPREKDEISCEGPDCPREKVDKSCEGPDCPREKDISCEGPDCPREKDEISCEGPDCPREKDEISCEGPDCPREKAEISCEGPDCPREKAEISCEGPDCPREKDEISCKGPDCPREKDISCEGPDCPREKAEISCEGPDCPREKDEISCEGPDCPRENDEIICEGPDCPREKVDKSCEGPDCPREKDISCEGPDCPREKDEISCEGPDCPREKDEISCEGPDCPREKDKINCEGPDCPREKVDKSCEGPDCPREKDEISCEGPNCPREKDEISCEGPECSSEEVESSCSGENCSTETTDENSTEICSGENCTEFTSKSTSTLEQTTRSPQSDIFCDNGDPYYRRKLRRLRKMRLVDALSSPQKSSYEIFNSFFTKESNKESTINEETKQKSQTPSKPTAESIEKSNLNKQIIGDNPLLQVFRTVGTSLRRAIPTNQGIKGQHAEHNTTNFNLVLRSLNSLEKDKFADESEKILIDSSMEKIEEGSLEKDDILNTSKETETVWKSLSKTEATNTINEGNENVYLDSSRAKVISHPGNVLALPRKTLNPKKKSLGNLRTRRSSRKKRSYPGDQMLRPMAPRQKNFFAYKMGQRD